MSDILTPEQRAIILLSRLTFSENNETDLKSLLNKPIDWYEILRISINNKVLPLIWYNLQKRNNEGNIPSNIEKIMYFYYLGTRERNNILLKELDTIIQYMNSKNIPCIPLKGAYLIPNIYRDFGIRTMNDIDFMINHSNVSIVRAAMNELGYIEGEYEKDSNKIIAIKREKKIFWNMKMNNLFPFKKISDSDYVKISEFDFCFSLDFDLNYEIVDNMISRVKPQRANSSKYLCDSDFFIHLCCHLYKEATNAMWVMIEKDLNLIKFCDIREFVLHNMNSESIDEAIEIAKKYRLEKAVYYTLFYLNQIYSDGYELEAMKNLNISDDSFIYTYGAKDFGENVTWKKSFWQRIFSNNNRDELTDKPKYLGI